MEVSNAEDRNSKRDQKISNMDDKVINIEENLGKEMGHLKKNKETKEITVEVNNHRETNWGKRLKIEEMLE